MAVCLPAFVWWFGKSPVTDEEGRRMENVSVGPSSGLAARVLFISCFPLCCLSPHFPPWKKKIPIPSSLAWVRRTSGSGQGRTSGAASPFHIPLPPQSSFPLSPRKEERGIFHREYNAGGWLTPAAFLHPPAHSLKRSAWPVDAPPSPLLPGAV